MSPPSITLIRVDAADAARTKRINEDVNPKVLDLSWLISKDTIVTELRILFDPAYSCKKADSRASKVPVAQ